MSVDKNEHSDTVDGPIAKTKMVSGFVMSDGMYKTAVVINKLKPVGDLNYDQPILIHIPKYDIQIAFDSDKVPE